MYVCDVETGLATSPRTRKTTIEDRKSGGFVMGMIICGSMAFSIGGAFMKASNGLTRFTPTLIVLLSFVLGAGLLTRAVTRANMSTTVIIGLGFEAVLTMLIGFLFLGDRVSIGQAMGIMLVLGGITLVKIS
jgi:multidrug transporter EmrE-like cation transporter